MLPSDMNLKIRSGTVRYNNKILISDGKFSLGKNNKVNSLVLGPIGPATTRWGFTSGEPIIPMPEGHPSHKVVAEQTHAHELAKKTTHEEEKIAFVLFLARGFTIWNIFYEKTNTKLETAVYIFKLELPPKTISVRNFKHFDRAEFLGDLRMTHFDEIKNYIDNTNEMWPYGKLYNDIFNRHAPIINIMLKGSTLPYMTNDLKNMICQCDHLKAKAVKTGSKYLYQAFIK